MKIALEPSSPATALHAPSDLERLRKSAREFEGIMLSSLWKEMQQGEEGEEGELGETGGPLQEVAMQALATQAAKGRGIGIAQMIERSLVGKVSPDTADSNSQAGTATAGQALNENGANSLPVGSGPPPD
jgi:Rod binding domain-containing protein